MNEFLIDQYSNLYREYEKKKGIVINDDSIVNEAEFMKSAIYRVEQTFKDETEKCLAKMQAVGRLSLIHI